MTNIGLIGRWRLDESAGSTAADTSGNNLDGQLGSNSAPSGLPMWIPDGPNGTRALRFRGDRRGFVEVTPKPEILEPCVVSVEAWVRSSALQLGQDAYIVSKGAEEWHYASYALYTGDNEPGGLSFYVSLPSLTSPRAWVESPFVDHDAIWDGKWHHVVGTFDGRIVRLYVDGTQQGTGRDPRTPVPTGSFIRYNLSNNNRFYIGMYRMLTAADSNYKFGFDGDIRGVHIWAGVLSSDEVMDRYRGQDLR